MIPFCGPTIPLGSWFVQTWISTTSGSFHINLSFPGPVVLERKIFKDFPYIIICKTLIPYCGPIVSLRVMIWTNLNLLYIRKNIFKNYLYTSACKTLIPYCGPILPPGVMIWTNSNLLYIRKLPYKFQSWPSSSWEEDF